MLPQLMSLKEMENIKKFHQYKCLNRAMLKQCKLSTKKKKKKQLTVEYLIKRACGLSNIEPEPHVSTNTSSFVLNRFTDGLYGIPCERQVYSLSL